MAWLTRPRTLGSTLERPSHRRRAVRAVGLVTAVGLLLALAEGPATGADSNLPRTPDEPGAFVTAASTDPAAMAAQQAAETRQPVEVEGSQTATATTYANPDGTSTLQITQEPTRANQAGQWVDIDPNLHSADGVLSPSVSQADVQISDGIGDGAASGEPLAQVTEGASSLALNWPANLPEADVDGATASFDTGSKQVRVSATGDGFAVHVVLGEAPTTAPVYRLPVTAKGVRLVKTDSGEFRAENAAGKAVFWIAPPVMWDHTQDNLEAGPEHTTPVQADLIEDADGSQTLELRPPMSVLTDPATVYPVTVDPDVFSDATVYQDTYVSSSDANRGFPSSTYLRVGYDATTKINRSYMQFNIPAHVGTVTHADLRVYQYDAASCTPSTIYAYRSTQQWRNVDSTGTGPMAGVWYTANSSGNHVQPVLDKGATYSGQNAFTHGLSSCPAPSNANSYDQIDVTNMVAGWVTGAIPNYGLGLRASTESSASAYKAICSANVNTATNATSCYDGTNPPTSSLPKFAVPRVPTLLISYNTPPEPIVAEDMAVSDPASDCTIGAGRPIFETTTPNLSATARDINVNDTLSTRFEVRALSDGALAAGGYAVAARQGTASTWRVPAGALTSGVTYVWRAQASDTAETQNLWSDDCEFTVGDPASSELPYAQSVVDENNVPVASPVIPIEDAEFGDEEIEAAAAPTDCDALATEGTAPDGSTVCASEQTLTELPADFADDGEVTALSAPSSWPSYCEVNGPTSGGWVPQDRYYACAHRAAKVVVTDVRTKAILGVSTYSVAQKMWSDGGLVWHHSFDIKFKGTPIAIPAGLTAQLQGCGSKCTASVGVLVGPTNGLSSTGVPSRRWRTTGTVKAADPGSELVYLPGYWKDNYSNPAWTANVAAKITEKWSLGKNRCDNRIGNKRAACVFKDFPGFAVMVESAAYPLAYKHAQAAIKSGLPGGTAHISQDMRDALHKASDAENTANRSRACGGLVPTNPAYSVTRPGDSDLQCDEYPMASAREGAASTSGLPRSFTSFTNCRMPTTEVGRTGRSGYSHCYIPGDDNRDGGKVYANMYRSEHLLPGDPFYVVFRPAATG